jgi:hypothetical protein
MNLKKVLELENSIEKAETALNELNQTLDRLIDFRFKLNKMEAEMDDKILCPSPPPPNSLRKSPI